MRLDRVWEKKFSAFVRLHRRTLLHHARRVCRANTSDAEDLVQETLERGLEAFPDLRSHREDVLLAYLFTTMTRLLIDQSRRRRREVMRSPALVEPAVELADLQVERWRTIPDEALHQAERSLRPRLRQAYELRRAGKSYVQIAREMNASVGTVGSWIFEARNEIRKILLGENKDPDP